MSVPNDVCISRDVKVALDVLQMAAYGYFKEEYLFYCYAYQHEEKIIYKISENPLSIYKAYRDSVFNEEYPTPIQSLLKNMVVPAGERPAYKLQCKMELIQKMRSLYGQPFFEAMQLFQRAVPLDTAVPLLEGMLSQLTPQAEAHQLFCGLCQQALEAKLLTLKSYTQLTKEADRVCGEQESIVQPQLGQGKLLSGFIYWKDANSSPVSYCSATLEESYIKYCQLRHNGVFCSPIIKKSYWFRSANAFKSIKVAFRELLQSCIANSQAIQYMNQLYALPPAINKVHYSIVYDNLKQHAVEETCTAFHNYGYRFHLLP